MIDSRSPKPKLRWYQFSLRTLLLFVLVAGVGLGWLGRWMLEPPHPRTVLGELCDFRPDARFGRDGHVLALWGFRNNSRLGDDALKHIERLSRLQRLDLGGTKVTDTGLEHLKGLTSLGELSLDNTQITDAGLEHLEKMRSLRSLFLRNTRVTEAGLEHLKTLIRLRTLNLDGTQVTDAGLEHLRGLVNLQTLDLGDTQVTVDGVKKLQRALPNCEIRF